MAYDYIGLVNDVNNRLNEVALTTSNFATATGYFSFAKDAVNAAIRHINQEEYEWPWNHVEESETLLAGTVRYSYPNDSKTLDMDSFRVKRDDSLNIGSAKLKHMSYEEWLEKHIDTEYNTSTSIRGVPTHVVRAPSREFIIYPNPDKAYEIVYEYYRLGYDLENHSDIPSLPEQYRFCIIDGAMHYAYQFRGDTASANMALQKFQAGIKYLRSLNINRMDYIRDTRVHF